MLEFLARIRRIVRDHSTKARIAFGQAGMIVSLILTAAILGLIPDHEAAVIKGHTALAEAIAANSSVFLTRSDFKRMEANLSIIVDRNSDLLSAGIRADDGKLQVEIGDHQSQWQPSEEGSSISSQVSIPIMQGQNKWGQVEMRFLPLRPDGWLGWLALPLVQLIVFVSAISFLLFFFYLGRMLKQLDPSQAIPGRVRSALDAMAEGLLVIDARQNIVLANSAFASIVNRNPDDLLGYQASNFPWANYNAEPFDSKKAPWALALKEGRQLINTRLRLELVNNKSWSFMVNCSPVLADNGKASGVLISFDDVTELEEKEIELQKSKEEADAANQSKSDFLANMSHEIRTPMNAILGFTDALRRGFDKNSEESQKYLNTIYSSGNHLLELINDILDLSKVEAGRIEVESLAFPPHLIVHEVVKIMATRAREKNVSIAFEPDGPLPGQIESDPGKIRQILTNLIGNALKFTETGGVRIVTRFASENDESHFVFEVHDTGIGMTEAQAARIFESFVQAESSISRRFGGTGLGLAISKRFAEAMGGGISVSSQPGKGSIFICTIRAQAVLASGILEPEQLLLDDTIATIEPAKAWIFPESHILVVDDGAENRDLMTLVLRELNLDVATAANGQLALDMVKEQNFDLILMDVSMPVMDGYTAVGLMRKNGLKLPVIALTAHAMKGVEEECIAAGYSDYMAKPIDIELLTNTLAEKLGAKQVTGDGMPQSGPAAKLTDSGRGKSLLDTQVAMPIRSTLSMSNPTMRELVVKFITRLDEQLDHMERAFLDHDFEELAKLSHWLKGSAGSIGFHDFTQPATEIESLARQQQAAGIEVKLLFLRQLYKRIEVTEETSPSSGNLVVHTDDDRPTVANAETPAGENQAIESQQSMSNSPIYSSLPLSNMRIREIVERFIVRLEEQLCNIEQANADGEYEELARLGHWLKGSGGTVGFHQFTEPATELEIAAKKQDEKQVALSVETLRHLFGRVILGAKNTDVQSGN